MINTHKRLTTQAIALGALLLGNGVNAQVPLGQNTPTSRQQNTAQQVPRSPGAELLLEQLLEISGVGGDFSTPAITPLKEKAQAHLDYLTSIIPTLKEVGHYPPTPLLHVYDSSSVNAESLFLQNSDPAESHFYKQGNATIMTISSALMEKLEHKNPELIKFVVSHEYGHIILGYNPELLTNFINQNKLLERKDLIADLGKKNIPVDIKNHECQLYCAELYCDSFYVRSGGKSQNITSIMTIFEKTGQTIGEQLHKKLDILKAAEAKEIQYANAHSISSDPAEKVILDGYEERIKKMEQSLKFLSTGDHHPSEKVRTDVARDVEKQLAPAKSRDNPGRSL
jgi:hypothetical protein